MFENNSRLDRTVHHAKSFLNPNQVAYLIFYVTNRCNFRCDFCFYHEEIEKGKKAEELSLEEIKQIAPTIGPLLQLSLTGGEPFLRDDFAEVASTLIAHTGAPYVTIPTNASLPKRMVPFLEEVLARFPETFFRLVFSVDGIGEDHDKNRSYPGSWKKIVESFNAISPMRKRFPNLVLDANLVFSATTEEKIRKTVETLNQDFSYDNLSVTYARGEIKDPELKKVSAQKYIELNDCLENMKRKKEKRSLYPVWRAVRDISRHYLIKTVFNEEFVTPCVAGRKLAIIYETGEVHPCEILGKGVGNLRDFDYNFKKVMHNKKNKELTRWIVESKCKCSFECALAANVLWGKSSYSKLFFTSLKNIGKPEESE